MTKLITLQLNIDTPRNGVKQLGLSRLDHIPRAPGRQSYGGQHNIGAPRTSTTQAAYAPGKTTEVDKAACAREWVLAPVQLRFERLS